jgi:hypothetical protein
VYQIEGKDVIFAWLEHEHHSDCRYVFLTWLANLSEDPHSGGPQRVPGILGPVYIEVVPLGPKHIIVRFLIAEQFHTVRILGIGPLP